MDRLAGRTAIITGGGSGIGSATARVFAEEGARVLLVGRQEPALRETVKAIGGEAVSYAVADTSSAADTERYVAIAVERYGGLDVLVSNPGTEGSPRLVGEQAVEDFDEVLAVNLRGVWLSYRYALPELTRRGRRVGGSDVVQRRSRGLPDAVGVRGEQARRHRPGEELRAGGCRRRDPGQRSLPGLRRHADGRARLRGHGAGTRPQPGGLPRRAARAHPPQRLATPEEAARLILFLASDESSYVTGATHVLDGGVLAGIL